MRESIAEDPCRVFTKSPFYTTDWKLETVLTVKDSTALKPPLTSLQFFLLQLFKLVFDSGAKH